MYILQYIIYRVVAVVVVVGGGTLAVEVVVTVEVRAVIIVE